MFALPLQNISLGSKNFRIQNCKQSIAHRTAALKAKQDESSVIDALDGLLGSIDESTKPDYSSDEKDSKVVPVEQFNGASITQQEISSVKTLSKEQQEVYAKLEEACNAFRKAPVATRYELTKGIQDSMDQLKELNAIPRWGCAKERLMDRFNTSAQDLVQVGIKDPESIARGSVQNEFTFIFALTAVCSILAVAAGQLPGDWGFFVPYSIGGIVLGALAIGSTSPGLLQIVIDQFSQIFPDYRNRVVGHEAAHFLLGYLLGIPLAGYSLALGQMHTEFAEAKLQARLEQKKLDDKDVDLLGVVAMAGVASEGLAFAEVMGQMGDLTDLQRVLNQSKRKLNNNEQQTATRWAVYKAAALLKSYKKEHEALKQAMASGKSVGECIQAIEKA